MAGFVPHVTWLVGAGAGEGGGPVALVLHGILGSGGNWRSFGRRWVENRPSWTLGLVDLRHHGSSHGAVGPNTLSAVAGDLGALAGGEGGRAPTVLVGHSYGGKVALAAMSEGVFAGLRGVVVVDSPPGPSKASVGGGVEAVVASLRALPQPIESREQVVGALVAAGLGLPLAQWMTTNLERQGEGFVFRFNLDAVPEMMADFRRQDLWPRVFAPPESARVLLVRGGRSDAWSPADDVRWAEFGGQWPDRAALVSEAGHWVHAEAPEALWTAMAPWLDTAAGA